MALRRNAIVALATLGLSFGQFLPANPTGNQQGAPVQDPDEYAVYTSVLKARYATKGVQKLVIDDYTPSPKRPPFIGFIGGMTFTGAKRPRVQPETARDFDAKNQETFALENHFGLALPCILVAESNLHEIFHLDSKGYVTEETWRRFYENYPGSQGIISLSRVGFNGTKDQALVYVANQSDLLGGAGLFFVLSKNNSKWEIQKSVMIWLS